MVIWKVIANQIGPDDGGAIYCETKEEAARVLREHKQFCRENGRSPMHVGTEKVVVKNRADLCRELNAAMGYGAS